MSQKRLVVRKSLQWNSVFLFLIISILIPILLFQFYYYFKELRDIKNLEQAIEDDSFQEVEKKILIFFQQYGVDKEILRLQLKLWDKKIDTTKSFDQKVAALMFTSILSEHFLSIEDETFFLKGKLLYSMGNDYYSDSLYYLKQYLNKDSKLDQNLVLREKAERMLYQIYLFLENYQQAYRLAEKKFQASKDAEEKLSWQMNLAKILLSLNRKDQAINYLESAFLNSKNEQKLEEIGLLLVEIAYELNLKQKVDFYYYFLLSKKIVTSKFIDQHRSQLLSKKERIIL